MALTTLVGFDNWSTTAAYNLVNAMLGSSLAGTPVPGQNIPQNSLTAFYDSTLTTIRAVTLNGVTRNFLCERMATANSYIRYNYSYANSLQYLPKTGKWYFGMRMYYSYIASSVTPVIASIRLGSAAAWNVTLPSGSTAGMYYFELVVDWVNLTVTAYVNGVQVGQQTGSTYVTASYTSMYMYIGPQTGLAGSTSNSYYHGFTDVYFIVEESTEANPISGRLGPIMVKQQPIAAVSNSGRFTPPSNVTVLDALNNGNLNLAAGSATYTMNTAALVVNTDPHGDIAEATFAAPAETAAIKAVQIQTITHKLQAAAAGTTLQLKQGSVSKDAIKTVPGLYTAPLIQNFGYTKAFDGTDWTADKVGQIKVDIGSYRP